MIIEKYPYVESYFSRNFVFCETAPRSSVSAEARASRWQHCSVKRGEETGRLAKDKILWVYKFNIDAVHSTDAELVSPLTPSPCMPLLLIRHSLHTLFSDFHPVVVPRCAA